MTQRWYMARPRGEDVSGVVLADVGGPESDRAEAARLLSHVMGRPFPAAEVELLPWIPPERDRLRL